MDQVVHTNKCFCDIPREKLAYLVQQHFIHHVPTTELMEHVHTEGEKEEVAIVALLDVPKDELTKLLSVEDPKKLRHWLDCHYEIRRQLAEEGLYLRGMIQNNDD